MALTGPEPKAAKMYSTPNADWVDVPNVPYAGARPELPESRIVIDMFGNAHEIIVSETTKSWWAICSAMPQCSLWTDADWAYALDTAILKDVFYASPGANVSIVVEIRRREDQLGTTAEARRKLRIRYVEQAVVGVSDDLPIETRTVKQLRKYAKEKKIDLRGCANKRDIVAAIELFEGNSNVTSLDDRRRRLTTSAP